MERLSRAPMMATRQFAHQGNPTEPRDRPADCMKPDKVGPIALHRLADEAAVPFKVPSTLFDRAEFASKICRGGKAKDCAVTFHTTIR